jgi:RNA recognition motif-containing protein
MAKRFTDTDKWDDEWFMDLEPSMKCLWLYICDKCDCAGVWKVNFKKANYVIGAIFDKQSTLKAFNGRITEVGKEKWFVEKFIKFQYPKGLSDTSSIHKGVLKSLNYNGIQTKPYLSLIVGAQRVMDKDMDKDSSFSSFPKSHSYTNSALKIDNVIQLFNDKCSGFGKITFCRGLSGKNIQDFLTTTSFEDFRIINTWQEVFQKTIESDFLTGQQSGSTFVATLNWLVVHDNALKVLNGQYGKGKNENATSSKSGHHKINPLSDHEIELLQKAGQI